MELSSTLPNTIGKRGETRCPAKVLRSQYEQFRATFGQRNDSILLQWLGEKATSDLIQRIGDAKEALYREHVRQRGISSLPGALEWIHLLHRQGWLQAIASAAPRANIETILDVLHASECFEAIVSAEDVHRGKPDPEVFLIARRETGCRARSIASLWKMPTTASKLRTPPE